MDLHSAGPSRPRLAFVGLLVATGFFVVGPSEANPPNQGGINSSAGMADPAQGAPSYSAPKPAGVGTGRKVG